MPYRSSFLDRGLKEDADRLRLQTAMDNDLWRMAFEENSRASIDSLSSLLDEPEPQAPQIETTRVPDAAQDDALAIASTWRSVAQPEPPEEPVRFESATEDPSLSIEERYGQPRPMEPATPVQAQPSTGVPAAMPQITALGAPPGGGSEWETKAFAAAQRAGHPNPREFVEQMRWESGNFDPAVITGARRSSAGAIGIAQIMPEVARGAGVNPLDPDAALTYAANRMAQNYRTYGDSERALAEYNMGAGNLRRHGPRGLAETRAYLDIINERTRSASSSAAPRPGATPAEETPEARAQAPTSLSGITPPQFGLGDADAEAICGPVLAMAFARANGRNPTIQEAKQLAAQNGGWTRAQGMGGPEAMANTLRSMGIPATYKPGALDVETIRRETQNGNPVGINTRGHYFVVEGVDEQGRLDLGNSAKALRASGGRHWFRPEEIAGLGMGAPTGAIYKDSPSSPTPSVAVRATGMPPAALPNAGAAVPPAAPAAPSSRPPAGGPAPQAAGAGGGGVYVVRDQWGNELSMTPEQFRNRPGGTSDLIVIREPGETTGPTMQRMSLADPPGLPQDEPSGDPFANEAPGSGIPWLGQSERDNMDLSTGKPLGESTFIPRGAMELQPVLPPGTVPEQGRGRPVPAPGPMPGAGPSHIPSLPNIVNRELEDTMYRQPLGSTPGADSGMGEAYDPRVYDEGAGAREWRPPTPASVTTGDADTADLSSSPSSASEVVSPSTPSTYAPLRSETGADDPDSGPRESGYVMPPTTTYNDPTAGGTQSQPIVAPPAAYGASGDAVPSREFLPMPAWAEPAPAPAAPTPGRITWPNERQLAPPAGRDTGVVYGPAPVPEPPSRWSPAVQADLAGTPANPAPEAPAPLPPANPVEQAVSAAGRSPFLNEGAGQQAVDIYNAIQELPFEAYARARQQLVSDAEAGRLSGTDPVAPLRALGIPLPSPEVLNPQGRPASDVLGGLILAGALPDPTDPIVQTALVAAGKTLGLTARGIRAGVRVAAPVVEQGVSAAGRGVRALGEEAAGQLMDLAPTPRIVQPGSGGRPVRATVEVLQEQLEAARQTVQRGIASGDPEMLARAQDARAAVESQLVDAMNARRALEPAIASDVGRRIEDLPLDERTADDLAGLGRERVRTADLGGPVSVVPETDGRANAALPFDPSGAALGAGAGAATSEEGEEPDPWRAAEGALLGLAAGRVIRPGGLHRWQAAKAKAVTQAAAARAAGRVTSPTAGDWLRTIGYSSMLGPSTGVVNAIGNGFELLWHIPKDIGRATARGNLREAWTEGQGLVAGALRSGGEMLDALAGASNSQAVTGMLPLSQRVQNPIAQTMANLIETPSRLFSEVPDAFYRSIAQAMGEHRAAAQIATREGLSGRAWSQRVTQLVQDADAVRGGGLPAHAPTQQIIDDGTKLAERLTLRGEPSQVARGMERFFNTNGFTQAIGHLTLPFLRTPDQMIQRMGERSLAGLRMGTQPTTYDKYYDVVAGSGLSLGVVGLAMAGSVSGSGPDDPEKKAMLRSRGWLPNSTLMGGVWVPNNVFGVFGPILDTAGEIADGLRYQKKDGRARDLGIDMAKRMGSVVQNQVYLRGLSDLMKAMRDPGAFGESYLASTASRLIPAGGTLRTIATAEDPNERRTDPAKEVGTVQAIRQRVAQNIPNALPNPVVGTRGQTPVAQDVLGRPVENERRGLAVLGPRTKTPRSDPAIQLFQDAGVDIGKARDQMTVGRVSGVELKPDEQRRWNTHRGQFIQDYADAYTGNADFMALSPSQKEKYLKTFLDKAADYADKMLQSEMDAADLTNRATEQAQKKAG